MNYSFNDFLASDACCVLTFAVLVVSAFNLAAYYF